MVHFSQDYLNKEIGTTFVCFNLNVLSTINKQVDQMSYLQVTACRPSLHIPDRYNTLHGLAVQRIAPMNVFNLHNSLKPTFGLSKKCTELMTRHMILRTGASRYQQCTPVCLFGGQPFGGKRQLGNDEV